MESYKLVLAAFYVCLKSLMFYKFLIDKLEFLEKIKEKFIDMSKNIAGSALKNIAGPIEWLKYINEFFENTSWVTRVIAELLTTNGIK